MAFTKSTRREKPFFERDKSVCRVVVNFAHDHRTPARSPAGEATFMRSTRTREREDDNETTLGLSLEERCDPTEDRRRSNGSVCRNRVRNRNTNDLSRAAKPLGLVWANAVGANISALWNRHHGAVAADRAAAADRPAAAP